MKHLAFLATALFPILLMWLIWISTACSFNIRAMFASDGVFWYIYGIYLFVWLMMSPALYEYIIYHH